MFIVGASRSHASQAVQILVTLATPCSGPSCIAYMGDLGLEFERLFSYC